MTNTTIETHNFHLHITRKEANVITLTNFCEKDAYDLLKENFVNFVDTFDFGKRIKKLFKIPRLSSDNISFGFNDSKRYIYGILESGIFGEQTNIVDIDDKDNVIFEKQKNHAELKPFFFLIQIPTNSHKGILILERVHNQSVAFIFHVILMNFFKHQFALLNKNEDDNNIVYKHNNLILSEVVENFIREGDYRKITISKDSIPPDVADKYNLGRMDSSDFKIEINIIAKHAGVFGKQKARNKIIELYEEGSRGFFSVPDFENIGIDDDADIKVLTNLDDKQKTISLYNHLKFRPFYEIFVTLNDRGFSDFESIKQAVSEFLENNI